MRIQNFGSWSPYMVKDGRNVLGLEYTVLEGDDEWNAPDEELIERAKRELEQLGLVQGRRRSRPATSCASPRPTRSTTSRYRANVDVLRGWLGRARPNVHPVGRNGMFRYNNQDHSMFTAMLTVENIATGTDPRHLGGERRGGVPRGAPSATADRAPAPAPTAPAATPR